MSTPGPAKRRRLDEATSVLSKPFKSPLKTPTTGNTTPKRPASTATHGASKTTPYRSTPMRQSHLPPLQDSGCTPPSSSEALDPALTAAKNTIKDLESQIRKVKSEIETLSRAASIQSGGQNIVRPATNTSKQEPVTDKAADQPPIPISNNHETHPQTPQPHTGLTSLILKWRHISQRAADELYPSVKSKVEDMGGARAWRATERRKYNFSAPDGSKEVDDFEDEEDGLEVEAEVAYDENGDFVGEAERGMRRGMVRRGRERRAEMVKAGKEDGQGSVEVGDQEDESEGGFTMGMMLKSLNIEPDVIGWNSKLQKWET